MSRARVVAIIALLAAVGAATGPSAGSRAPSGSAADGAITGAVAPALRPAAGAVTTVRAIDAKTVTTAVTGRVGANGRYRLAAPPGVYLVLVEKVGARARPIHGFGRLVRVRSGRTAMLPTVAPGSAGPQRSPAGVADAVAYRAAASQPAVAVKYFAGTGPNAFLGKGLADMILTGLVGGRCYVVVEWERRGDLLSEIRLQQSRFVDPATRVTPRLIQPTIFVEGSVSTTASSVSWNIRMREIATGRIIGSDRGSAGANLFAAVDAAARRLREQLEKALCLPARFQGTFTQTGEQSDPVSSLKINIRGNVEFVRDPSLDSPAFAYYAATKASFTASVSASLGPCSGSATETASVTNTNPASRILLAKSVTRGKGHKYEILAELRRPEPANFTLTCPDGVTVPFVTAVSAAIASADSEQYSDENATRLQGTYSPTTGSTFTWDLKAS